MTEDDGTTWPKVKIARLEFTRGPDGKATTALVTLDCGHVQTLVGDDAHTQEWAGVGDQRRCRECARSL